MKLVIQAHLNTFTGYGQLTCETIAGLSERGWQIGVKPLWIDDSYCAVPLEIKDKVCPEMSADWELTIAPFDRAYIPTPGKRSIYWTMWEHDHLSQMQMQILKRCDVVLVPNEWNRKIFAKCVNKPVKIVPLGVHPEIFTETPVPDTGACVFGAGGCVKHSGRRKNMDAIIRAFQWAFPKRNDVELRLKVLPGESVQFDDPRIRINSEFLNWVSLARWFQGLTAFVNVGTEGWGLLVHQAMTSGRPVLSPNYGGVTAFFNVDNGYPIDYWMRRCNLGNLDLGSFMTVDEQNLAYEMRRVQIDRQETKEKGVLAARAARALTWENSVNVLDQTLHEILQA